MTVIEFIEGIEFQKKEDLPLNPFFLLENKNYRKFITSKKFMTSIKSI